VLLGTWGKCVEYGKHHAQKVSAENWPRLATTPEQETLLKPSIYAMVQEAGSKFTLAYHK